MQQFGVSRNIAQVGEIYDDTMKNKHGLALQKPHIPKKLH